MWLSQNFPCNWPFGVHGTYIQQNAFRKQDRQNFFIATWCNHRLDGCNSGFKRSIAQLFRRQLGNALRQIRENHRNRMGSETFRVRSNFLLEHQTLFFCDLIVPSPCIVEEC